MLTLGYFYPVKTQSLSRSIANRVTKIPEGEVFDYKYFDLPPANEAALAQALSRLSKKGVIERIAKGKFYKPRNTQFGKIKPMEDEVIRAVTYRGGKLIGYLTGVTQYNKMGFTMQVPNVLVIGTNHVLPAKKINNYKIKYSKRNVPISEENIYLLQILDVIKDIKVIPDTKIEWSFARIVDMIKELTTIQQKKMMQLAMQYSAATRALTGAIFEKYIPGSRVKELKQSLNTLTRYRIGISQKLLPNQSDWNIE